MTLIARRQVIGISGFRAFQEGVVIGAATGVRARDRPDGESRPHIL
jgi:hypothetical protein